MQQLTRDGHVIELSEGMLQALEHALAAFESSIIARSFWTGLTKFSLCWSVTVLIIGIVGELATSSNGTGPQAALSSKRSKQRAF
jgi:hypothetical protein